MFLGLSILVPLMQIEQLKFPKLARAYFTLLSYMLEVYPERVAGLPGALATPPQVALASSRRLHCTCSVPSASRSSAPDARQLSLGCCASEPPRKNAICAGMNRFW